VAKPPWAKVENRKLGYSDQKRLEQTDISPSVSYDFFLGIYLEFLGTMGEQLGTVMPKNETQVQRSVSIPKVLQPYVGSITLRIADPTKANRHILTLMPDGCCRLLLRVTQGTLLGTKKSSWDGDLSVSGSKTKVFSKSAAIAPCLLAVQFRPAGASALLSVPIQELTDHVVLLSDIWGASSSRLMDNLHRATHPEAIASAMVEALAVRAANTEPPSSFQTARRAVAEMQRAVSPIRMDILAKTLRITPRHLRRVFGDTVGVAPKLFARILRFQRAVQDVEAQRPWAEIATRAGYYDQAHLIAEFRYFSGTTPQRLMHQFHHQQPWVPLNVCD
jgi:AraC-like DNA-binding protein